MSPKKLFFSFVLLVALTPALRADSVTVGCAGAVGGPFDFTSVSDALTALRAISFRDHHLTIAGTCSEYVRIDDFESVRLEGSGGAVILDPGTDLFPTLAITRSENIELSNLVIRGVSQAVDLVRVFDGSQVRFVDCTIENSGATGLFVNNLSLVRVWGTLIQRNLGNGVRAAQNAVFQLGEPGGDAVPALVQFNRGNGIVADSGASVGLYGATAILDNRGSGLNLAGGSAHFCCEPQERQVLRNGSGITSSQGVVRFNGTVRISENRSFGILLNHGSTARAPIPGLVISENGSSGIFVLRSSEVDLTVVEITGNREGGLVLRENASARVIGSTITGNGAEGIHLSYLSTMSLFAPNTIEGNQGFDVYCTPDSRALGSREGVRRMACPGFNHIPDPDPGIPPGS